MNSTNYLDVGALALNLIFVAIALLLTHFFDDSDRHRGTLEKLRAKYLSPKAKQSRDIIEYLSSHSENSATNSCEDCIHLKLINIHFGIISGIIFGGISLMLLVTGNLAWDYWKNELWFEFILLLVTIMVLALVQITYIDQQKGTLRRLLDFESNPLEENCNFKYQCKLKRNDHNWEQKFSSLFKKELQREAHIVFIKFNILTLLLLILFKLISR